MSLSYSYRIESHAIYVLEDIKVLKPNGYCNNFEQVHTDDIRTDFLIFHVILPGYQYIFFLTVLPFT